MTTSTYCRTRTYEEEVLQIAVLHEAVGSQSAALRGVAAKLADAEAKIDVLERAKHKAEAETQTVRALLRGKEGMESAIDGLKAQARVAGRALQEAADSKQRMLAEQKAASEAQLASEDALRTAAEASERLQACEAQLALLTAAKEDAELQARAAQGAMQAGSTGESSGKSTAHVLEALSAQ